MSFGRRIFPAWRRRTGRAPNRERPLAELLQGPDVDDHHLRTRLEQGFRLQRGDHEEAVRPRRQLGRLGGSGWGGLPPCRRNRGVRSRPAFLISRLSSRVHLQYRCAGGVTDPPSATGLSKRAALQREDPMHSGGIRFVLDLVDAPPPQPHASIRSGSPSLVPMSLLTSLAAKFRASSRAAAAAPGAATEEAVETFRDGINCTQAILSAWGARHGLDRDTALRLGGAFGSGMNMGETCGAVTGALMVIGLRHAKVSKAGFFFAGPHRAGDPRVRRALQGPQRYGLLQGVARLRPGDLTGARCRERRDRSFKTRVPEVRPRCRRSLKRCEGAPHTRKSGRSIVAC